MSDRSESAMALGPGFCRAGRQQSQASGARRPWPALSILVLGALAGLVPSAAQALDVPPGFDGFQFATPYSMHNPFSKDDLRKIDDGFKLFTTEKFKGNGRVCASCHIPERGYNISAGDMDRLKHKEAEQALGGSNRLLENDEILQKLALFNINQTFGPESAGATTAPEGPFRASMSIGGLGFTTLNRFVCRGGQPLEPTAAASGCDLALLGTKDGVNKTFSIPATSPAPAPGEFSLYYKGTLLTAPADYTFTADRTIVLTTVAPASTDRLVAYFPGSGRTIDDGARDIMLGWAGDGAPTAMFAYHGAPVPAESECKTIADAAGSDLGNLDKVLDAFSLAAVKTHFPRTQNRVPGVDFRCPKPDELRNMTKFQKWLGRRFELDITRLQNLAPAALQGRNLFSSRKASCVACHVNAGASDNQGRIKLNPVPFLTLDGAPDPDESTNASARPLEIVGANKTSRNGSIFYEPELDALVAAEISGYPLTPPPATFSPFAPFDEGDGVMRSGGEPGFNVASIIEAVRKNQFFHNNAITGSIEDAIAHYFTDRFDGSQGGGAINSFRRDVSNVPIAGPVVLDQLGGTDALDRMGLFLRALSSMYALADCERFVDEIFFRFDNKLPLDLPTMHCGFALDDAGRMLGEARVVPNPYAAYPAALAKVRKQLDKAVDDRKKGKIRKNDLLAVQSSLRGLRQSIATTPELP